MVVETGYQMLEVLSLEVLWLGEGFTSFNKGNSTNFSGEKKFNEAFQSVYFLRIRRKTLSQISSW